MDEIIETLNYFEDVVKLSRNTAAHIGDCPNLEVEVFSEPVFWKCIDEIDGWKCQENIIFGTARVISPDNIRKAQGSVSAMREKLKRLTAAEFMVPGDILGVSRSGLYEHYAIYIGNRRVIHYCGEEDDFEGIVSIHEAPLSEFLKDSEKFFVVWFDDGMPIKLQNRTSFIFNSAKDLYSNSFQKINGSLYSAEETIERAKSRIGETSYNLAINNCEHFAMWCKTGVSVSGQVNQMIHYIKSIGDNNGLLLNCTTDI